MKKIFLGPKKESYEKMSSFTDGFIFINEKQEYLVGIFKQTPLSVNRIKGQYYVHLYFTHILYEKRREKYFNDLQEAIDWARNELMLAGYQDKSKQYTVLL